MEQFYLTSLLEYFVNWAQFPSALNMFYDMGIFLFSMAQNSSFLQEVNCLTKSQLKKNSFWEKVAFSYFFSYKFGEF